MTEFIVFGSKAQYQKLYFHFPVIIPNTLLHLADTVRNLVQLVCGGSIADFSFSEYV